jgi:flagellar biosynthesis chaperone FliJ
MTAFRRAHRELMALGLVLGLSSSMATAQEPGRFVLKEADQNTFIRLDTLTGSVSRCSSKAGEWSCQGVKDDRAALNDEIAALRKENAELKQRLSKAKENVEPETRLTIPSEAEIDRWLALVEKYFERFLSLVRRLERDQNGQPI